MKRAVGLGGLDAMRKRIAAGVSLSACCLALAVASVAGNASEIEVRPPTSDGAAIDGRPIVPGRPAPEPPAGSPPAAGARPGSKPPANAAPPQSAAPREPPTPTGPARVPAPASTTPATRRCDLNPTDYAALMRVGERARSLCANTGTGGQLFLCRLGELEWDAAYERFCGAQLRGEVPTAAAKPQPPSAPAGGSPSNQASQASPPSGPTAETGPSPRAGDRPHTDEDMAAAIEAFEKRNSQLTDEQRRAIIDAVKHVTSKTSTFEVGYQFFRYYSGIRGSGYLGPQITVMSGSEAESALRKELMGDTDPRGDTRLRPDVFERGASALGALLLHELSHTGHNQNSIGGNDYQEGQAYAVEYFYAEKHGLNDRMLKIRQLMSSGSVATQSSKPALQNQFKVAYAVLSVLHSLISTGNAQGVPVPGLDGKAGEMLFAEVIMNYQNPSDRLRALIEHVGSNLDSYPTPTLAW